jgi:hypothetical protein
MNSRGLLGLRLKRKPRPQQGSASGASWDLEVGAQERTCASRSLDHPP